MVMAKGGFSIWSGEGFLKGKVSIGIGEEGSLFLLWEEISVFRLLRTIVSV